MLHIRLSRVAAGPPALDDCVAYIESEARQAVEFRPGSLGISGADGPGDGVAGQPPVQVVPPDGQAEHTDAEIEPVEHEVTGPQ